MCFGCFFFYCQISTNKFLVFSVLFSLLSLLYFFPKRCSQFSQMKGLNFPGSVNPQFCRLVLQRSRHLLKPVREDSNNYLVFFSFVPCFLSLCFTFCSFVFSFMNTVSAALSVKQNSEKRSEKSCHLD